MLYDGILSAALFAGILKAVNAFRWRSAIVYFLLSSAMTYFSAAKNMPEIILLYTFEIFAIHILFGIVRHRINRSKTRQAVYGNVALSLNSLLIMFSIGYFFTLLKINQYVSFFATMALYLAFSKTKYKGVLANIWKAIFVLAIAHSFLASGGSTLLYPTYYVALYIAVNHLFYAARDAFSYAYAPDELKEGMIPAESILYDGKKYVFGSTPFPSVMGLVRYATGDIILKRRIVASFLSPLKKENIDEIKLLSKKYNRKVFLVQKEIDFLPFVVLGSAAALVWTYV